MRSLYMSQRRETQSLLRFMTAVDHCILPETVDHCILPGAVVLPGTVDYCVLTVCALSRAADHYVLYRLPGDDDDGLGQRLLDKELGQVVHSTGTSQHPQVLDLLVLGLLDEELHGLGQVLDMLGQGLLDEELHTIGLAKLSTCLCRGYMTESCTPLT